MRTYLPPRSQKNRSKEKMRVIAGSARRIPLAAPSGTKTRPTSDRAKEGLFGAISARVEGASFLDLYCGSGQVGIEALSRGAALAVFVDSCPDAVYVLRHNLEKTRLRGDIMHQDVPSAIRRLGKRGTRFDVVFLDPPYGKGLVEETLQLIAQECVLNNGALVIAESETKLVDKIPGSLYLYETRAYGAANFLFMEFGDSV